MQHFHLHVVVNFEASVYNINIRVALHILKRIKVTFTFIKQAAIRVLLPPYYNNSWAKLLTPMMRYLKRFWFQSISTL